jgi:hypothetical protein
VRALQTEEISSNVLADNGDQSWNVHFAAFLAGASTKGEVRVRFVDLTDGKREEVADGEWSLIPPSVGVRVIHGAVQLLNPWFVSERRYEMTLEVDRVARASTTFWLLTEHVSSARSAATSASASPAPARRSPDIANGATRGDDEELLELARRVPGSGTCALAAPGSGQTRWLGTFRSSPGLRLKGLNRETIRSTVRRHAAGVRACYDDRLTSTPELHGRILSRFVIGPEGRVRGSCAVKSDLNDVTLELCILDELLTITSSELIDDGWVDQGWVNIEYPFVLLPGRDDGYAGTPTATPSRPPIRK